MLTMHDTPTLLDGPCTHLGVSGGVLLLFLCITGVRELGCAEMHCLVRQVTVLLLNVDRGSNMNKHPYLFSLS